MSNSNNLDLENYLDGLLVDDVTGGQPVSASNADLKSTSADSSNTNKTELVTAEKIKPAQTTSPAIRLSVDDVSASKRSYSPLNDAPKRIHAEPHLDVATKQRLQQLLSPSFDKPNFEIPVSDQARNKVELEPDAVIELNSEQLVSIEQSSDLNIADTANEAQGLAANKPLEKPVNVNVNINRVPSTAMPPKAERPNWSSKPFDVLMLDVNGLTLAVPLVTLGQIHPLNDELTPIVGRAKWFLGMLPTVNGQIYVLNSALYVMPERYKEECVTHYKYVVTLADSSWGLAVDSVQQPTRLSPEEVTWRTNLSKRPWLAGTVKSAMCALIDAPILNQLLLENLPPA